MYGFCNNSIKLKYYVKVHKNCRKYLMLVNIVKFE